MKRLFVILLAVVLTGCAGYGYPVRDGGDGVYYAESPPVYTYVNGYFGFPYYGPWDWSWYYPVWYSPMAGHHYSWYCPRTFWADPVYRPMGGWVRQDVPHREKPSAHDPLDTPARLQPIMPMDMRHAVIGTPRPSAHGKRLAFGSPEMKNRAYAKTGNAAKQERPSGYSRSSYSQPRPMSRERYDSPRPSSRTSTPRQQTNRHVSENEF